VPQASRAYLRVLIRSCTVKTLREWTTPMVIDVGCSTMISSPKAGVACLWISPSCSALVLCRFPQFCHVVSTGYIQDLRLRYYFLTLEYIYIYIEIQ